MFVYAWRFFESSVKINIAKIRRLTSMKMNEIIIRVSIK